MLVSLSLVEDKADDSRIPHGPCVTQLKSKNDRDFQGE